MDATAVVDACSTADRPSHRAAVRLRRHHGPVARPAVYRCGIRWFVYLHAGDVGAARTFYRDVVGLTEVFDGADGTVGFRGGDVQLTVARHDAAEPGAWASQLGWDGGTAGVPSWGVELDAEAFDRAVAAATRHGCPTRWPAPEWVGYWSFPIRDPMGNTVELSTPDRDGWAQTPLR